jgi:hypothetical protein
MQQFTETKTEHTFAPSRQHRRRVRRSFQQQPPFMAGCNLTAAVALPLLPRVRLCSFSHVLLQDDSESEITQEDCHNKFSLNHLCSGIQGV